VEEHRVEVDVGEVDALFGTVVDVLASQVTVQVHLAQTNRVALVVSIGDGTNRLDVAHLAHCRQRTDGDLNGASQVSTVHRQGDVERSQVAADVLANVVVAEVLVVGCWGVHLEDLGAEVGHVDAALDWVGRVYGVLVHYVWVARLKLQLCDALEEHAGLDLGLLDAWVVNQLLVLLGNRDVTKRNAVDALNIVWREQVHVLVVAGQLQSYVRNHHTDGERLDADLLVGVLTLGVEEAQDVWVVGV